MVSRASFRAIVASVAVLGVGGVGACVLADPPAALPTTAKQSPQILQTTPSTIYLLESLPTQFVLSVVVDPRETQVAYELFADRGSSGSSEPVVHGAQDVESDGGPTLITVDNLADRVPAQECHTLEISVFYPLDPNVGSTSVTWFYSPTGSFANCLVFDAGPADASDGSEDAPTDAPSGSD